MKKSFSKWDYAHMKVAETYAQLSSAVRLQVGSIIVKDNRVISIGYNGMPSGWDNTCEYEEEVLMSDMQKGNRLEKTGNLKTKPEVLHAEANAITKLARCSESGLGSTLYITHAPCMDCAKLIHQAGIKEVIYKNKYKSDRGLQFLHLCGITVNQLVEHKETVDHQPAVA